MNFYDPFIQKTLILIIEYFVERDFTKCELKMVKSGSFARERRIGIVESGVIRKGRRGQALSEDELITTELSAIRTA